MAVGSGSGGGGDDGQKWWWWWAVVVAVVVAVGCGGGRWSSSMLGYLFHVFALNSVSRGTHATLDGT